MKKILCLFLMVLSVGLSVTFLKDSVHAAYIQDATKLSKDIFNGLPDEAKLIVDPGNGYYSGNKLEITDTNDKDFKQVIKADDPLTQTITVGKLRQQFLLQGLINANGEIVKQPNVNLIPKPILRGLTHGGTAPATQNKAIAVDEFYLSDYFTGSGWRYAGFNFVCAGTGNGPYLFWQSWSKDSGMVGTPTDAQKLHDKGILGGHELGPDIYVKDYSTYYTHNPDNARYRVSNPKEIK